MSVADNLLANYDKVKYTSYYKSDMIIGTHSSSFAVSSPPAYSYSTSTDTFDTGFGTSCYFQGVFSTDGGATWNDFGVYQPNLAPPFPQFQTQTCRGYVTPSGVFTAVGINWYDISHSSGSACTILYKVVFFAKKNQGSINPLPVAEKTAFDSRYNVQKIYLNDTFSVNPTGNTTIAHTLGYYPKVRSFFEPASSTSGIGGAATIPAGAMTTLDWFTGAGIGSGIYCSGDVEISTSGITFTQLGVAGTQHYIIYLDA